MSNTYNPCITIGKNGVIAYDENNETLTTAGDLTAGGNITVTGDISGVNLTLSGTITTGGTLTTTGNATINGSLSTTGNATINGELNINKSTSGETLIQALGIDNNFRIILGKTNDTNKRGTIKYEGNTDRFQIYTKGAAGDYDKSVLIDNTGTITAPILETTSKSSPETSTDSFGTNLKAALLDLIYPIGSIYTTTKENNNPATLFGGTWTNIKDVFLYAADPSNPPTNLTGGSSTHNHNYKMRYSIMNDNIAAVYQHASTNGGILTYDYANNTWTDGSRVGDSPGVYSTRDNEFNQNWILENTGTTSIDSNLPPYRVVYVYERTA